jgi:DNA helicase-2/ATP-dependent DNA helicase PcrA
VGDPRQATYLTHQDKRFSQYKDGKIEQFIEKECLGLNCSIDKETLKKSHRNNAEICAFSSRLYPDFPASEACTCIECRQTNSSHTGIFVVKPHLISLYVETCQPVILRYKEAIGSEWNFGKAKGLGFDHILIYPTDTFITYLHNGRLSKTVGGKTKPAFDIAKYYVSLTRARYIIGIVYDYHDSSIFIEGIKKFDPMS